MKYLLMDTSHLDLNLALVDGETMVAQYTQPSPKTQSENIIPMIQQLFNAVEWRVDELDGVVITKGPGSYTGVRIAMTVAKVLCTTKHLELYTLSTLQALAGMHTNTMALLDARSGRVFAGVYHEGKALSNDAILTCAEAKSFVHANQYQCVGDAHLIEQSSLNVQILHNMIQLKPLWEHVESIHQLTPTYLKEQDDYGK